MPKFICISLVRHGEADRNVAQNGKFIDEDPDPLTWSGRRQVKNLGISWAQSDTPIDILYSSPLERAVDTAKAIAAEHKDHPEIIVKAELVERKFGTYLRRLDRDSNAFYAEINGPHVGRIFGGEKPDRSHRPRDGGESLEDVANRAETFFREYIAKHAITIDEKPDLQAIRYTDKVPVGIPHIVVVSHNVFLTELYEVLTQWNSKRHIWTDFHLRNAQCRRFLVSIEDAEDGNFPARVHEVGKLDVQVLG
ncbi:phosphoglycerate mutase-like protein [Rickenella mellea]|uniref:Phosphoglycerate mutase-like protein n=1 Tax=Rickenella mellea TaxID=50990 RepID=A0A4Y7PZZ4_9AGAM|nr:phosphoglycerate mutase-like protein [Rickenella mellea]